MAWIYLFIAAVFETAWTFSLKFMAFKTLKTLRWDNFYTGLPVVLPFVGYVVFGLGNVYFFSLAIKYISTATAFAVWTAVTLVLIKLSETFFLGARVSIAEIGFMLLIMTGILGMKFYGQ